MTERSMNADKNQIRGKVFTVNSRMSAGALAPNL